MVTMPSLALVSMVATSWCVRLSRICVRTATDPSMFTEEFMTQATRMEVTNGQVITYLSNSDLEDLDETEL